MGLLNFFKKPIRPYKDHATNLIYELLFCDNIELYKTNTKDTTNRPWATLFSTSAVKTELEEIINSPSSEARVKILAFNKLKSMGLQSETHKLLAVIVEVALDEGLDTLAAFSDGTARYINHTGNVIAWETPDEKLSYLINQLFLESNKVVGQIGPWDKPRRQCPEKGNVRITFLVSDRLYFGEGPMNVLFTDPLASTALSCATELMGYMIEKSVAK